MVVSFPPMLLSNRVARYQNLQGGRKRLRRKLSDRWKNRCLINKYGKRRYLNVPIGAAPDNLTKPMVEKIDSEKGRKIYSQRIAIVEPVFANIETHKGMDRFTLRGKIKVNIQWLLYCMVHNIGKIMTYGFT